MRYILSTLLVVVTSLSVKAQVVLKVMMVDRSEITVSIDGRDYKRVGRSLTFIDIPAGWHDLRVYRYIAYREGGGRAQLVYSSRIKLKNGNETICIVDGRKGRMRLEYRDVNEAANKLSYSPKEADMEVKEVLTDGELSSWVKELETMPTDIEKLKSLKLSLVDKEFSTQQMKELLKSFAFESSALELAKWGYDRVTDADNYLQLIDVFSLEESRKEFKKYIAAM